MLFPQVLNVSALVKIESFFAKSVIHNLYTFFIGWQNVNQEFTEFVTRLI